MGSKLLELLHAGMGNQAATGMILMGGGAALIAYCRSLPQKLWALAKRQLLVSVEIQSTDDLYQWVTEWLDLQPYSQKTRKLSGSVTYRDNRPSILLTPAPGEHWFVYKGRLLWLHRQRKDVKAEAGQYGNARSQLETIEIRMLGRRQGVIRDLLLEARQVARKDDSDVSVHVAYYGSWAKLTKFSPRPLSTVFLPEGVQNELVADLQEFLSSQSWYQERGIPWRRGYLFHGAPGGGKSSMVSALAGALKLNLYMVNLAAAGMSDENLQSLLLQMPSSSAVLFEDIDAVLSGREIKGGESDRGITFSGLLNALDGVAARPGQVIFMTTNCPEKLDPALCRRGRVDMTIEFLPATGTQISQMVKHFYGQLPFSDTELMSSSEQIASRGLSMAEIQHYLIQHRTEPRAALLALNTES